MDGINDIFIQTTYGIPYVARCYGGKYCKIQPDHELVTGFFAAINSFKGELGQNELNNVVYDKINLVFDNSDEDLLVVCNIDRDVDEEHFREIAAMIRDKFIGMHEGDDPNEDFTKFIEWMDSKIGTGMGDLRPLVEPEKGFFARIKSWFSTT